MTIDLLGIKDWSGSWGYSPCQL